MKKLTDKQIQLLQHTLGAGSRYKKKDWGFRNRFYASNGSDDYSELVNLEGDGYVVSSSGGDSDHTYFEATIEGAKAVGFKSYQLKKLRFNK